MKLALDELHNGLYYLKIEGKNKTIVDSLVSKNNASDLIIDVQNCFSILMTTIWQFRFGHVYMKS